MSFFYNWIPFNEDEALRAKTSFTYSTLLKKSLLGSSRAMRDLPQINNVPTVILIFLLFLVTQSTAAKRTPDSTNQQPFMPPYLAVVAVPITDGVGVNFAPDSTAHKKFSTLPCSWTVSMNECPRHHQFLFNQIVMVTQETKTQACIQQPNLWFTTPGNARRQNSFWILKSTITPVARLSVFMKQLIPELSTHPSLVLSLPFTDPETAVTYSAGTRFVKSQTKQPHRKNSAPITLPCYHTQKTHQCLIPLDRITKKRSDCQTPSISNVIHTLQAWTQQETPIAYVWGGCSFANKNSKNTPWPKSGFDCAGLLGLAARINDFNFPYKNSYTIANNLRTRAPSEGIIEGDLLYFSGHILIISSIKPLLLIEARSYDHGYGIVHEIPFQEQFSHLDSIEKLQQAYLKKTPLIRKDKKGTVRKIINEWKVLACESLEQIDTNYAKYLREYTSKEWELQADTHTINSIIPHKK